MKLSTIAQAWDQFFFAKVSPYPVAAYRILQGIMLIQFAISFYPDLLVWFGNPGIVAQETIFKDAPNKLNVLGLYPDSNVWVYVVWIVFIVSAFCFTIGFQTRLAAIINFVVAVSLCNRDGYLFNAGDTFLRSTACWLVFAPSAEVWSVDAFLKKRRNKGAPAFDPLVSAWTLRALQIQMCLVYYSAFACKTPGWYWAVGESLYIAGRFETLQRLPMPFSFDNITISQIFTWGTLFIEFALFTLVWIKEFRYYILAMALCMHLTIDWFMSIPMFEWFMIVSFVLWLEPEHIVNSVENLKCILRNTLGIKARGAPVAQ